LHSEQVRGYRFLAGRGPRRSATLLPAPLRYWQYRPAAPTATGFVVAVVGAWLGVFAWVGGWPEVRGELPLALTAGLVVLLLSTGRTTVSDHGLSFDVAGARTVPETVVPLMLVREVRLGGAPDGWPTPKNRGGWWPGRSRVAVRHLGDDGAGDQALTLWVRDPQAFATALGRPLPVPSPGR
jgi:hypothetical protein